MTYFLNYNMLTARESEKGTVQALSRSGRDEIKQGGGRLGLMLVVICSLFPFHPGVLSAGEKPWKETTREPGGTIVRNGTWRMKERAEGNPKTSSPRPRTLLPTNKLHPPIFLALASPAPASRGI